VNRNEKNGVTKLECSCQYFGQELPDDWDPERCQGCMLASFCLEEWENEGSFEAVMPEAEA
jgi:hypothetical protein